MNNIIKYVFVFVFLSKLNAKKIVNNISVSVFNKDDDHRVEFCDNCQIFLGGLFPIHAPKSRLNTINKANVNGGNSFLTSSSTSTTTTLSTLLNIEELHHESNCGEIKKERGIQRLEAMLYAIDLINNSTSLLPNIKLGAKIYDTCDRDTIALEKCMNFINDHFLLNEANVVNDFVCPANMEVPTKNSEAIYRRKVVGVIGAASSSVSLQVANILRLFQIPQISYASTSPDLSNRERFPYFSRVLPSDTLQAEAMAILVRSLNWNYVATISEEGNFGGIEAFITNAKHEKICISGSYTLSQTASENDVNRIVLEMWKEKNSRAVVMFLQDHNIKKLLSAVQNLNLSRHFIFVASDSWGTKKDSIDSYNLVAESTITFAPKSYEVKGFNDYFKKLNPKTNVRNPWFKEFWERQFNCTMNDENLNVKLLQQQHKQICTGEEQLDVTPDGFIHFVIDSVYAMAHAIQSIIETSCQNISSEHLLECKELTPIKGPRLLKEIRNVEFDSITGRRVKFLKEKDNIGDGIIPFEVFQYQQYEKDKYHYTKIAEWDSEKELLTIDMSKLKWREGELSIPKSVCKEECDAGEIKQGDTCCWVCVKCDETEYSTPNKTKCVKCPLGYGPNDNKTSCQKLPIEYMDFNSPLTIISVIIASIGIIFTCYCIAVFLKYSETPIIKASGRELCYVLLAGIMSCYTMTFPLVTKPTVSSCLIMQIGVSLSLTICLSALFTKTNRLSRIFNSSIKKVRQASYVSPRSQLVICFSIISIQLIGLCVWLATSPPGLKLDYNDPKRVVLQCKTHNSHVVISLVYNLILVILCTTYAIKTRKIPENFNEARFIGFTMYAICLIWISFVPIYFVAGSTTGSSSRSYKNNFKIQLTTLALCLSASATVIHACLFMPKLKIVLLKPNKNVRIKTGNVVKSIYSSNLKGSNSISINAPNNGTTNTKETNLKQQIVSVSTNSFQKTIIAENKKSFRNNRFFAILWPKKHKDEYSQLAFRSKSEVKSDSSDATLLKSDLSKKFSQPSTTTNNNSYGVTKRSSIKKYSLGVDQNTNYKILNRDSIKLIDSTEDLDMSLTKIPSNNELIDKCIIENGHVNDSNNVSTSTNENNDTQYCIMNKNAINSDSKETIDDEKCIINRVSSSTELKYFNEYTLMSLSPWTNKKKYKKEVINEDNVDNDSSEIKEDETNSNLNTRTVLFSSTDNLDDSYTMRITFV